MMAAWASIGCDSNSFVPPRPEELGGAGSVPSVGTSSAAPAPTGVELAPVPARAIEVVLDQHDPDEAEVWKTAARTQAGFSTVKLKIVNLEANDAKARQVELVREAIAHHPRVLVVEPADPADTGLAAAIHEAGGQGIPVVLMSRPLAALLPAGEKSGATTPKSGADTKAVAPGSGAQLTPSASSAPPVVVVAPPPFAPSAQELVLSAIRNAKEAGLEIRGGALVISNTAGDPFIEERARAIVESLKAAGISPIKEGRFAKELPAGEKVVKAELEANPKVVLVFAADSTSSLVVRQMLQALANRRPLVLACYASEEQIPDFTRRPEVAAVAEFTPQRLVRKAISTAVALSQGKEVPRTVELPVVMNDMAANARNLKAQLSHPQQKEAEK